MLLAAAMVVMIIATNYMFWNAGKSAAEIDEEKRIRKVLYRIDPESENAMGMVKGIEMLMDIRKEELERERK